MPVMPFPQARRGSSGAHWASPESPTPGLPLLCDVRIGQQRRAPAEATLNQGRSLYTVVCPANLTQKLEMRGCQPGSYLLDWPSAAGSGCFR